MLDCVHQLLPLHFVTGLQPTILLILSSVLLLISSILFVFSSEANSASHLDPLDTDAPTVAEILEDHLIEMFELMAYRFMVFSFQQFGDVEEVQGLGLDYFFEPEETDVFDEVLVATVDRGDHEGEVLFDLFD